MLTTISFDKFMSLENDSLTEASENFDFNEFKKMPLKDMATYLTDTCDIPLGGRGSSREVYLLNKSELNFTKGPACIKLVRTDGDRDVGAGIGQNREEASIIKKFQGAHDCFPLLYYRDAKNYFIIVELGTPLSTAPKGFINSQLEPMRDTLEDFIDEFDYPSPYTKNKFSKWFNKFSNKQNFTEFMVAITTVMVNAQNVHKYNKDEIVWFNEFTHFLKDSNDPITYSIYETIHFAMQKGARQILWTDFIQPANWAFVCRNGYFMLIPIDWGFTSKVAKDFYGWGNSSLTDW